MKHIKKFNENVNESSGMEKIADDVMYLVMWDSSSPDDDGTKGGGLHVYTESYVREMIADQFADDASYMTTLQKLPVNQRLENDGQLNGYIVWLEKVPID